MFATDLVKVINQMWKKSIILVLFGLGLFINSSQAAMSQMELDGHIRNTYGQFKFNRSNKMSLKCFSAAVKGYYNLREEKSIPKNILTVCDFSLSSKQKRLWVLDMKNHKVLVHTYAAHGQGSGGEFARKFSNVHNSHTSSQGFYITANVYNGKNGESLKLHGVDGGFNSAAYARAIVLHGAAYADPSFIRANGRLGRSYGCPAVPTSQNHRIIQYIKGGSVLFVYSPLNNYLKRSHWIKSPVSRIAQYTEKTKPKSIEKEIQKEKTKIVKRPIPRTEADSISAGLIAPNTKLADGKIFISRQVISEEEAKALMERKRKQDLKLSSGIESKKK